jgi:hypothetical protein
MPAPFFDARHAQHLTLTFSPLTSLFPCLCCRTIYNEKNAKLTAVQASLLATQPAKHQLPALAHLQQQLTEVQTSLASTVAIFLESEAIVHWQNLMGLQQQLSALATSIEEQAQGSPVKPFPTLPFPALQPFPGSLQMPV